MTTPTIAAPAPSATPAESLAPPEEIATPPAPTRRRFTVAEYYVMADAGVFHPEERVELLDGEIIAMPPIGDWHAASVKRVNNLHPAAIAGTGDCERPGSDAPG